MTKLKTICFAVTTAALAGCAAMPRHYDDESSRALNLARAGGVYDQDLRNSPDGTRSYRKGLLVSALDLASLATSLGVQNDQVEDYLFCCNYSRARGLRCHASTL